MSIKMRLYAGEADLQGICDLCNACEAVDRLGQSETIASVSEWVGDPALDHQRDFRL